jgi:hypothetical protein
MMLINEFELRGFHRRAGSQLGEFDFCGLLAAPARVVLDLKGNLVALSQAGRTGVRKRIAVDENVLLAIVRRDEAEAARLIKEFYCAVEAPSPLTRPMAIAAQTTRSKTWRNTSRGGRRRHERGRLRGDPLRLGQILINRWPEAQLWAYT